MPINFIPKSAFKKGNKVGNRFKKGYIPWNKGKKLDITSWNKGMIMNEEFKAKLRKPHKRTSYRKELHHNWNGGTTSFSKSFFNIREYSVWRKNVYMRDYYTCKQCGAHGGKLVVHHIIPMSKLIHYFLAQYNQFSYIEDREILFRIAINHKPFWEVNNGITLCETCHKSRHVGKLNYNNWNKPFKLSNSAND